MAYKFGKDFDEVLSIRETDVRKNGAGVRNWHWGQRGDSLTDSRSDIIVFLRFRIIQDQKLQTENRNTLPSVVANLAQYCSRFRQRSRKRDCN